MTTPIPFTQTLLSRAHSPKTASEQHSERITKRPLYLRPTSPPPSARALRRRALHARHEKAQKRRAHTPRPLSAAKKRELGLLEIPKGGQKYEIYEPLHNLWMGYMREILGLGVGGWGGRVTAATAGPVLASADMHGAVVEVVRSRCVSRVGVKGIVVRDCRSVFEIVTKGGGLKSIPKEHTMFRFEITLPTATDAGEAGEKAKPLVFDIIGEQFQSRAPDRAKKIPKMHYQPDI